MKNTIDRVDQGINNEKGYDDFILQTKMILESHSFHTKEARTEVEK